MSISGICVASRCLRTGMLQGVSEQIKDLTWGVGEIREKDDKYRKEKFIEGERNAEGTNIHVGRLRASDSDSGVIQ